MDIKRQILWRVYILYFIVFAFCFAVVIRALYIQVAEGDELMKIAQKQELRYFSLEANRGNILSDDGDLLASTIPVFEIRMDVASPNISNDDFSTNIDSLSLQLFQLFGDKPAYAYKRELKAARSSGNRYFLIQRDVTYEELKRLRTFPIFRRGKYRGGLIVISKNHRENPYKDLAKRTLGYVNLNEGIKVGLEGAYTEILEGVDGKQLRRKIANGDWKPVNDENDIEPQNGYDIITTLNVNLQDVAQNGLREHLKEHQANSGCVVLMEVQTGAIKAIANLRYDSVTGQYIESYNDAIGSSIEPGSTFKLASIIAALETGKIRLTDTIDVGTGWTMYHGKTMKDVHAIRDGRITVREAFELSSNVGISKVIDSIFHDRPSDFINALYAMRLNEGLGLNIPGEGRPFIKHPDSSRLWSATSLPWMSIGYGLTLTPLQTLTFYNAIANNGVMMKPMFVKEIQYAGETIDTFEPQILHSRICSKAVLDSVQSLLEGVVLRGTAKILQNEFYSIAGKTGTAKVSKGPSGYYENVYNASFVGYFPADHPRYSCIVVVNRPQSGKIYGGSVAAPVFREIADKIYAGNLDMGRMIYASKPAEARAPDGTRGKSDQVRSLYAQLGIDLPYYPANDYIRAIALDGEASAKSIEVHEGHIPDVRGMTAQDAVFLLEDLGLQVIVEGKGWVAGQSIAAGTKVSGNTNRIKLTMKN